MSSLFQCNFTVKCFFEKSLIMPSKTDSTKHNALFSHGHNKNSQASLVIFRQFFLLKKHAYMPQKTYSTKHNALFSIGHNKNSQASFNAIFSWNVVCREITLKCHKRQIRQKMIKKLLDFVRKNIKTARLLSYFLCYYSRENRTNVR